MSSSTSELLCNHRHLWQCTFACLDNLYLYGQIPGSDGTVWKSALGKVQRRHSWSGPANEFYHRKVVAANVERLLGGVAEREAPDVLVAGGVNVLGMKELL
jgi:hypothetical protein